MPKRFHPIAIPTISSKEKISSRRPRRREEGTNRNHVCVEQRSQPVALRKVGRRLTKSDTLIVCRSESRPALDARSTSSAKRRSRGRVGILRLRLGRRRHLHRRSFVARRGRVEGDGEVRGAEDGDCVGALVLGDRSRPAVDGGRRFAKGREDGDCDRNVVRSAQERMSAATERGSGRDERRNVASLRRRVPTCTALSARELPIQRVTHPPRAPAPGVPQQSHSLGTRALPAPISAAPLPLASLLDLLFSSVTPAGKMKPEDELVLAEAASPAEEERALGEARSRSREVGYGLRAREVLMIKRRRIWVLLWVVVGKARHRGGRRAVHDLRWRSSGGRRGGRTQESRR